MKPNELRLGNFVMKGKNQHRIFSIDVWGQLSFDAIKRKPNGNAAECEGIPLTTEWLERFGFEKINGHGGWFHQKGIHTGKTYLDIQWDKYGVTLATFSETTDLNIEYVHQLQNLYFALTGNELELKQSVTP